MSDITTELIERDVPCAFAENDEMLKGHLEVIARATANAFQIEHEIAVLTEKAKPYRDVIKDALESIKEGTTQKTDCMKTVYWEENRVEVKRMDTGEVIEKRAINEDDRQMRAAV